MVGTSWAAVMNSMDSISLHISSLSRLPDLSLSYLWEHNQSETKTDLTSLMSSAPENRQQNLTERERERCLTLWRPSPASQQAWQFSVNTRLLPTQWSQSGRCYLRQEIWKLQLGYFSPSLLLTWRCDPRTLRSQIDSDKTWKNRLKKTTDQRGKFINFLLLKDFFFRELILKWIIEMSDVLSRFFSFFLHNFQVFRPEKQGLDILTGAKSFFGTQSLQ